MRARDHACPTITAGHLPRDPARIDVLPAEAVGGAPRSEPFQPTRSDMAKPTAVSAAAVPTPVRSTGTGGPSQGERNALVLAAAAVAGADRVVDQRAEATETDHHQRPACGFRHGHGNPMNALLDNSYTAGWRQIGKQTPKPKAILQQTALQRYRCFLKYHVSL